MASDSAQSLSSAQIAELSALADETLDRARRPAVEAWIASSPELTSLLERERVAIGALHRAAAERAPLQLRARIETERALRAPRVRRRARFGALAGAIAAAAAVVAVAVAWPGNVQTAPLVSQAARLALRGPSSPAPPPDPADARTRLADQFQQLYFPNWSATIGWRPVGTRSDRLDGRPTTTVYYQRSDAVVAYTIVGSPALSIPAGPVTRVNGFDLHTFNLGGRTVVSWRRAGHTCVLSAVHVPLRMLEQLAGWPAGDVNE